MTDWRQSLNLKKSLGQHFLKDESVSRRIVDVLMENPFTQLLEIGPGAGALTKYLVECRNIHFKAVEIDREKAAFLKAAYPALVPDLLEEDFLRMKIPFEGSFTVIGNFPYNISTQILFKILDWKQNVERVIGMFQKEVAQRIAAKKGNKTYGVISVLLQAFYRVEYLFEVSEQAFHPPPKVKSAVIRLTPIGEALPAKSEKMFFLLVKTAFNQRRKMLRNAVKGLFTEEVLREELFSRRAEELTVAEFAGLTWRMTVDG
jgi:16S rRNA (adenine1518-N6/adenine1519-N6)-dimethyltransferase